LASKSTRFAQVEEILEPRKMHHESKRKRRNRMLDFTISKTVRIFLSNPVPYGSSLPCAKGRAFPVPDAAIAQQAEFNRLSHIVIDTTPF